MKFLIDEDLPRSLGLLLMNNGHDAIDVRDIGLRGAKDAEIAEYARQNQFCILTGDYDFSDVRNYPP
jgi:predicted nuclease of predicted toxin-antitoxin system